MKQLYSEWRERVFKPFNFILWIVATVIATLTGPFGTFATMDWVPRATFWTIAIGGSFAAAFLVMPLARTISPTDNLWQRETLCSLLFALVYAPPLWLLVDTWSQSDGGAPVSLTLIFFASLVMAMAVAFLRAVSLETPMGPFDLQRDYPHLVPPSSKTTAPRLLKRLPDQAKGPILRLQADDHLVRVHTPDQIHDLRIRLSDAIAEMEGTEGFYVHRSHWLTRQAIAQVKRAKGRVTIVTKDGGEVPVSRKFAPKLTQVWVEQDKSA